MAWNEPQIPTRSSRNQHNRMNRLLNWAIGIVCVAILIIGGYLLIKVIQPTPHTTAKPKASHATKTAQSVKSTKSNATASNQTNASGSGTDASASSDPSSSDSSTTSTGDSVSNTNAAYHFVGGGVNGPWSPIGTVQSEPHQTNYNKGEVDWNEQIKALLYATNINDNDYILWWLGNGGSADSSKGIISTKEAPKKKYDVILQWVKNQGWKPTSVTPDSGSSSTADTTTNASSSDASSSTSTGN